MGKQPSPEVLEPSEKDTDSQEAQGCSRFSSTVKSMSLEAVGLLALMSMVICYLIYQNIIMQTICQVDLGYPADKCEEIVNKVNATYKTEEREIQRVAAGVQAVTAPIFSTITILVVLFVGPWSDVNGRRIPLIVCLSGISSFPILSLVCYFLMGKLTVIQISLVTKLPMTITGGAVVFAMSAYSYISDTTTIKNRTVRTGVLSASLRAGTPLGLAVGAIFTKVGVGVVPSHIFAAAISLVALLILIFTIKNIKPVGIDVDATIKKRSAWIRYNPLTKLIQALAFLFTKRDNHHIFLLLVICHICYAAPGGGEFSIMYLFVRERLSWDISDYGFFSVTNLLMSALGVVLSMFVLSKKLKISDPMVGFIGGLSQIGSSSLYAFTSTSVMIYAASALDMMNGTIGVIVRSMLSKIVRPDEVGKMFSLLGVLESLLPLVMVPAYAMLYRSTATVFAGAFFFLSVAVTLPAEAIFMYFMCRKKEKLVEPKAKVNVIDTEESNEKLGVDPADDVTEDGGMAQMMKLMPSHNYSSNEALSEVVGLRRLSCTSK